jgi:hypothetical protein
LAGAWPEPQKRYSSTIPIAPSSAFWAAHRAAQIDGAGFKQTRQLNVIY